MIQHETKTNRCGRRATSTGATRPGLRRRASRNGFVLVVVLTVMTISLALFGLWVRAAIREQRRVGNLELRAQAVRLAEAGLRRAVERRRLDPQFESETWEIAAAELGGRHAAQVLVRIVPGEEDSTSRIEATAIYPREGDRRAQITRTTPWTNTIASRDES